MCGSALNFLLVSSYRKNEPLSDDEWDRHDWDMNLLEPLVEISDHPEDKSRKRKRKENYADARKKERPPNSTKVNGQHVDAQNESEFINIPIKQEPTEPVPEEEVAHTIPMATIPVNNTDTPALPVYVYVPQPQPVVLQHPVEYPVQGVSDVSLNQPQNRNTPSTSAKTNNDIPVNLDMETSIKQEEMENVFVMPFGADIQSNARQRSNKAVLPEGDIIVCDSPEETLRKNRTAAIAENLGGMAPSTSHKKLRDLTFKLVELNNKNLQCDNRIDKIKEEYRKKVQVVEIEKKGIEQEIDKVLASIQNWKEGGMDVLYQ